MRCRWDLSDDRLVMYWRVTGRLLTAVGVPRTSFAGEAGDAVRDEPEPHPAGITSDAREPMHSRRDGRLG